MNAGVLRFFPSVIHCLPIRAHHHNHHQEAPTLVRRPELVCIHQATAPGKEQNYPICCVSPLSNTGNVRLMDRYCNELESEKKKLPDLLCVPTVKRVKLDSWIATIMALASSDNRWSFYAGLGTPIFSRSKSSPECRPELGVTNTTRLATV
jgi:hypothetical protein